MITAIAAATASFTALAPGHCMLTRVFRTSGIAKCSAAVRTSGTARWATGFDPIGDAGKRQHRAKQSFDPKLEAVKRDMEKENPERLEALNITRLKEVIELVDQIKEMSEDPETKVEFQEIWTDLMERAFGTLKKLKDDPELADIKSDLMKNGYDGLPEVAERNQNSEKFHAVTRSMLNVMRKKTIKKGTEGMIKEMFDKFDVDADGLLNLDEYNALQLVTEGHEATYSAAQLEELVRSLNPGCEDPARGLPFEEFRFIYAEAYPEALEKDHAKIFGPASKI